MIRVTEHTARRDHAKPCAACRGTIRAGDTYRQLVAVGESEVFPSDYHRAVVHDFCAAGDERWNLRDDGGPPGDADPECTYIRERYGLDVRRGSRVTAGGKPGRVVSGTNHVWVRLDGARHPLPYHPGDVVPAEA